jgi:APA family basic amino acid/polyamine antiporter
MIVVLYGLNLLGLRTSTAVQNVLIGIKIAMLVAIISALVFVDAAPAAAAGITHVHSDGVWQSLGLALIAVSFTFGGYQSTINFGGEIRDSERRMPIAIVLGVLIITAIYLLANAAYVHVLGFDTLAQSQSIAAMVVGKLFGPSGANILSAVLIISVFGYVNVAMLSNPRVIKAMSDDGVLPSVLSSSPRMQHGALLSFTLLSILSVYVGKSFEAILNYTIFIDAIGLGFGAATVYWLSKQRLSITTHIAAAIFIGSCVFTSINIFMFDTQAAIYGIALVAGICAIGWIAYRQRSQQTT